LASIQLTGVPQTLQYCNETSGTWTLKPDALPLLSGMGVQITATSNVGTLSPSTLTWSAGDGSGKGFIFVA
jgi:hypothetical protein